jgi:hypothetical protein
VSSADAGWESQVKGAVAALVAPLEADGGRFDVEVGEGPGRRIVVNAVMGDCGDSCAMSYESLERLLAVAVQRVEPSVQVSITHP